MQYLISFLEGVTTFISPCLLPMLPIYLVYFAAGDSDKKKTITNSIFFVMGFSVIFISLGIFAGTIGGFLVAQQRLIEIIGGSIVILFGFDYLGAFKLPFLNIHRKAQDVSINGKSSAFIFGMVFSVSWTPCAGVFLGSALVLAGTRGSAIEGGIMLLLYSLGLGIPLIISGLLLNEFKSAFDFIKRNYDKINKVCGILLILMGIAMISGLLTTILFSIA